MNGSTRPRSGLLRAQEFFTRARSGLAILGGGLRAVLDMFYGATIYEMVRDLNKERARLEHMFVLVVFGDLLGIPILPPYYRLRLLPYVVPQVATWKRRMLREKDVSDAMF